MSTHSAPAFLLSPADQLALDRRRMGDLKAAIAECRRLVAKEERVPADLRHEGELARRRACLARYEARLAAAEAAP